MNTYEYITKLLLVGKRNLIINLKIRMVTKNNLYPIQDYSTERVFHLMIIINNIILIGICIVGTKKTTLRKVN